MKKLNIGMIGYGFMGRTHSNAFSQVNHFFDVPYQPVLKTICARNPERAQAFAAKWGYESVEADWRAVVESPDIELVDIASPNDTHAEIAIAAARAGKMVMCEKPLGRNAAESEAMVKAVEAHSEFIELAAIDMQVNNGAYVSGLTTQIVPKALGLLKRLKATGELRPVADPILARTLVSLFMGFIISERAMPQVARMAMRMFGQRAWLDGMVDLLLFGVLEDDAR